ncbi:MAG: PIN domain-containing protein, partial [Opitutales bacterium]|nr:PIN domain-containing protein [Opitutales bacterium]
VENTQAKGYDVHLSQIILCKSVWVLERCYKVSWNSRIEFLQSVLHDTPFQVEAPEQVAKALKQFSGTGADFADCLIAANAKGHGCKKTFTFEKKAKTISGMAAVD